MIDGFYERRKVFDRLIESNKGEIKIGRVYYGKNIPTRVKRIKYTCPCCGYPTLERRGGYEMCVLCSWEDDGQDDQNASEVWGGPNGSLSLKKARENFGKHFDKYSSSKTKSYIKVKKKLIALYELALSKGANTVLLKKIKDNFSEYYKVMDDEISLFEESIKKKKK